MTKVGNIFLAAGGVLALFVVVYFFMHYNLAGTGINEVIVGTTVDEFNNVMGLGMGISLGLMVVGKMINSDAEKKMRDEYRANLLWGEREAERERQRRGDKS